MLTEEQLGELIDAHYARPGDRLFRMERLPWYDVPSQNADREAWRAGRFDPGPLEQWATVLADDARRGLRSRRVRVLSERLSDDEAMTVDVALPIISRDQDIRILRRGEHPVPDLLDHDYWICRPTCGGVHVIAMRYSGGGAFLGAEIVPPAGHLPYLEEERLAWSLAEPYPGWAARHRELRRAA